MSLDLPVLKAHFITQVKLFEPSLSIQNNLTKFCPAPNKIGVPRVVTHLN